MAVNKPFYRICRPGLHRDVFNNPTNGYVRDERYLPKAERKSMLKATRLIIDDLEQLFEFIEPHSSNLCVFSHRIYELLLRTCTEIESCCRGVLLANGTAANNMNDYRKIEQSSHLSGYTVHYANWFPSEFISRPFDAWATESPLPWYQAYNDVKHNRSQSFPSANLKNLLDAISGLLCIIHAQIGDAVQGVFESNIYFSSSNPEVEVRSFTINPSPIPDAEKYDFQWDVLKVGPDPVQSFLFI